MQVPKRRLLRVAFLVVRVDVVVHAKVVVKDNVKDVALAVHPHAARIVLEIVVVRVEDAMVIVLDVVMVVLEHVVIHAKEIVLDIAQVAQEVAKIVVEHAVTIVI